MSGTGKPATRNSRQGGFTIIECLAVLAITGLASAIAFPGLERALMTTALIQSKQALTAHLRQARGLALALDRPETLVIAADGKSYGWNGETAIQLPPGLAIKQDQAAEIAFFPDGSASEGQLTLLGGTHQTMVAVSSTGVVGAPAGQPPGPSR
jgi:general secretion pathway protein H